MRAFWVVAATGGLVASALLHLLSFARAGSAVGDRVIWGLGVSAFVLALAMVARLRRASAVGRGRWGRLALLDWRMMVRAVPPGLRVMLVGAVLYAWMNFVLCRMIELPPDVQPAITLRMATGHLIFFFLVPLVFFRFVAPALEVNSSAETPSHP
jgi:ABC-type enterobactin transport system permease subunit